MSSVTREYLHEIFNHDGKQFVWAASPDGVKPVGSVVDTSPYSQDKKMPGHIRVRGMLFTVEEIEKIYNEK